MEAYKAERAVEKVASRLGMESETALTVVRSQNGEAWIETMFVANELTEAGDSIAADMVNAGAILAANPVEGDTVSAQQVQEAMGPQIKGQRSNWGTRCRELN